MASCRRLVHKKSPMKNDVSRDWVMPGKQTEPTWVDIDFLMYC